MGGRKNGLPNKIKRGLASLFVCAVVLFPLVSLGWWFKYVFIHNDPRHATPLSKFIPRKIDTNTPPKLFKEPLLSVTFDDGWESVYTVAAPILQRTGIHTTQYLISSTIKDKNYLSVSQIKNLNAAGNEIGCHTVTHPDLTSLSDKDLFNELSGCKEALQKEYGITPIDFASPYGRYDSRTLAAIKGIYLSQRNTNGDISNGIDGHDVNLKDKFDPYNIIGVTVRSDTPLSEIKVALDYTIAHNGWLVLNYHQVEDNASAYGLDSESLNNQLSYISGTQVKIVTVGQVINSLNNRGKK